MNVAIQYLAGWWCRKINGEIRGVELQLQERRRNRPHMFHIMSHIMCSQPHVVCVITWQVCRIRTCVSLSHTSAIIVGMFHQARRRSCRLLDLPVRLPPYFSYYFCRTHNIFSSKSTHFEISGFLKVLLTSFPRRAQVDTLLLELYKSNCPQTAVLGTSYRKLIPEGSNDTLVHAHTHDVHANTRPHKHTRADFSSQFEVGKSLIVSVLLTRPPTTDPSVIMDPIWVCPTLCITCGSSHAGRNIWSSIYRNLCTCGGGGVWRVVCTFTNWFWRFDLTLCETINHRLNFSVLRVACE